jgi:hypothetical protein
VGHLSAAAARLPRRFAPQLGKGPQCLLLLDREIARYFHLGVNEEIASTTPTEVGGAESGKAKDGSRLCALRNFQFFGPPFEDGDIDLDPE